jgi:uncharacterized lipoprotein YajG
MRIFIGALAVALLAGCASPSDLRSGTPTVSTVTTKNPKAYALCVFPQWQDARSEAAMSETQNGYRLLIAASGQSDELLDITAKGTGSSVRFYQRVAWLPGFGRAAVESAVKSCL